MTISISTIKQKLLQNQELVDDTVQLNLQHCAIRIRSNSTALITKLTDYFRNCQVLSEQVEEPGEINLDIIAIESAPPEMGLEFIDWKREPGKTGRKDEYIDIPAARVVRKVRTGMVFLQSESDRIAAGPCIEYDNQVINYINSQYMNWLQNNGWIICHASGLVSANSEGRDAHGVAIAGLSGGGKSTLMLQLLNNQNISYVTNDRLFIKPIAGAHEQKVGMLGIPKLPRINPGTIVGNQLLHSLLTQERLDFYQSMPIEQLWDIEEKNDVPVGQVYGQKRIQSGGNLDAFILLNWQREGNEEVSLTEVDITQRTDLLPAIMKSPGPFYQYEDGHFEQDTGEFDQQAYLKALSGVKIYEAKGTIDFNKMSQLCTEVIMSQ